MPGESHFILSGSEGEKTKYKQLLLFDFFNSSHHEEEKKIKIVVDNCIFSCKLEIFTVNIKNLHGGGMNKPTKKIMVSIWLDPTTITLIDKVAKTADITRTRLIHNLIEVGYDELKLQKNIGLVKLSLLLRKFKISVQPLLSEAEKKIIVDEKRKDSVSVRMDHNLITKIDSLSKKIGLTRKSFIEYVLEFEIRDMKAIYKIPGFFKTVMTIRDLEEAIRENWKKTFSKTQKILEDKTIELNEESENGSE